MRKLTILKIDEIYVMSLLYKDNNTWTMHDGEESNVSLLRYWNIQFALYNKTVEVFKNFFRENRAHMTKI